MNPTNLIIKVNYQLITLKHCRDGRGWQQSLMEAVQFHFFSSVSEPVFRSRRYGSAEGAFTYLNFSLLPFSFHMSLVEQALFKQYYVETSFLSCIFHFLVYTSSTLHKVLCNQACLLAVG